MSKLTPSVRGVLIAALALGLALTGAVGAQENDDVRIVVKKIKECAAGDCSDHHGAAIFISKDGEVTELSGEGTHWIKRFGHGDANVFVSSSPRHLRRGAFLGVQMTELTDDLRDHFGVPQGAGVMVSKVVDDSAAYRAGLQAGDIVSAVNGETVSSGANLGDAIRAFEAGETVNLEVWRDGRVQTLAATLEKSKARALHERRAIKIICEGDNCEDDAHVLHFGEGSFDFSLDDFDCGGDHCEVQVAAPRIRDS